MQGGQGRFRFLPLGPPAPPVTPLKRSLREGVRHCTSCLYCTKRRHHLCGGAAERKRSLGGNSKTAWLLRAVPLSATHFVRVHFPARGDSFWVVLPPACPERGGGCEQSEQTEGLQRGCSCLRQPLSQFALRRIASSPAGESLGGIHKLLYNLGGPPMTAPTPHLINLWQKQGDAQRPPYLHNLLR